MVLLLLKEELRFAGTVLGVPSVIIHLASKKSKLSVGNLDLWVSDVAY